MVWSVRRLAQRPDTSDEVIAHVAEVSGESEHATAGERRSPFSIAQMDWSIRHDKAVFKT
jgi:hypothetical protein